MNMTNKQILEKAIQKAIDGEWSDGKAAMSQLTHTPEWALGGQMPFVMSVIFNHDFAKALWGDGKGGDYYKLNDPKRTRRKLWEHMLQQMVIADDPIKYLGENI